MVTSTVNDNDVKAAMILRKKEQAWNENHWLHYDNVITSECNLSRIYMEFVKFIRLWRDTVWVTHVE